MAGGGVPNILHQVSVPVIDNDSCQDMFVTSGMSSSRITFVQSYTIVVHMLNYPCSDKNALLRPQEDNSRVFPLCWLC